MFSRANESDYIHTRGVVLRTHPFAESDLIMRILTPDLGKIGVIAKRSREQRKKNHQIETFDIGEIELTAGRGELYKLHKFVANSPFKLLRQDLDKINIASITCESFDLLIKEGALNDCSLYDALSLALEAINNSADCKIALKAAYIALHYLLKVSGFASDELSPHASLKHLMILLDQIEYCAEKGLNSRAMLNLTLENLSKENI